MHYHITENGEGNVVDLIPFCSDACHRANRFRCDEAELCKHGNIIQLPFSHPMLT
jgi:hypothetical protein